MGKRKLVALLNLSSWCLTMVERLFFTVPWGCLRFVIVVFPDHTHYLGEAGIDPTFGAHSTRAASTLKAKLRGFFLKQS